MPNNSNTAKTALVVDIATGSRTKIAAVGDVVLQFNPSTGRQVRQLRITGFNGESATGTVVVGKNKGATMIVGLDKIAA